MEEDHLRDLLVFSAMNDREVAVRVEAIRALEQGKDPNLVPTFRRIAQEDPSQAVRYQAERTIYEIEGTAAAGKEN
jgi:HEAT repeat protein